MEIATTVDDFESQPDDHADALEIGQRIYDTMRNTLIDAAAASVAFRDDKEQLAELKAAMGRNPKHFIKAVERFPELFDADNATGDIWEILGAVALSRIKDDDHAVSLYESWIGDGSLSLDDLKETIRLETERPHKATLETRLAVKMVNALPAGDMPAEFARGVEYLKQKVCQEPEIERAIKRMLNT